MASAAEMFAAMQRSSTNAGSGMIIITTTITTTPAATRSAYFDALFSRFFIRQSLPFGRRRRGRRRQAAGPRLRRAPQGPAGRLRRWRAGIARAGGQEPLEPRVRPLAP